MKTFTGSEIVFSHTYFTSKPHRILEIRTDSSVHSLSFSEVPETAGSYSFIDDGCGFYNRVLFWRTESSRIHFNEVCATQEVNEASLCLDLAPSAIIGNVTVTVHRGILLIVIPTPSAFHRLCIPLSNYSEINAGHQSVLSFFPTNENYRSVYDYHYFPSGITISKASVTHDFYGNSVCVAENNHHQLFVVQMPFARKGGSHIANEVTLSESSGMGRFFKRSLPPTLSLTLTLFDSESLVISAQDDGKIRVWSATDGTFKGAFLITECLRSDLEFDVEDLIIKAGNILNKRVIVLKIQLMKKVKFIFMSYKQKELVLLTTCDLYATSVVDFLFVESSSEENELTLWAISRESYEDDKQELDTMFQPYLLRSCKIDLNGTNESEWKVADPAVPNAVLDKLVFENMNVESVKQRIFDGDTYSLEIVQRAIQTICKCSNVAIQCRDWQALSQFTEEFVQSGQFIQMYLSDDDQNSLMTANVVDQSLLANAYERFWLEVQKCCNQFQETQLYPIAVWHSPTLGLVGTIQSCRFTVYMDADTRMQSIVLTHSSAIDVFFDIIKKYVVSGFTLTNTDCDQQMACKVKTDILCRIVEWFAEREKDFEFNPIPMKSTFLASSFSTALLATALRQRILNRLRFARVVSTIIKLLPEIFMLADKNFEQRSLSTISSRLSSISATVKHYTTLYFSLSSTFLSRIPNSNRSPKLVTIAQSFFKSGLPFSNYQSNFVDEDLDEMQIDNGHRNISTTEFSNFIGDALNDAMLSLWPESKSMTFPRFLANNKYYETLKDYCEKNQPYVSELSPVFYFFRGIACAGTGFPDSAATFFEEASQGIVAKNETLNGVLSTYTNKPYSYSHTLTDFYYVVMTIFKSQSQTDFVIRAGMFALKFADSTDPILSTIYALMFDQYIHTDQYSEAIRVLHMNPSKESQDNCLQRLINTLWNLRRNKTLVDLHYAEFTERVAELLEAKCRSMPLSMDNGFFELVYAFYIHRYSYEHAAKIMYFLCWRLRWVPQSREVLDKRLRVLSCVCQTVEMLPENFTISLEVNLNELTTDANCEAANITDENLGGRVDKANKWFSLNNVDKKTLYNEYLTLEASLALLDSGDFPNGPPVTPIDIYEQAISHRLYDTAFVVQRHFGFDISRLFNALTLDCISIGFDNHTDLPNWIFSNSKFVDYANEEKDTLKPHWALLVAYMDLSFKAEPANVLAIKKVAELFLERSLTIPKWLETRYLKVNSRYFYHQLIEFDELEYAFQVLITQLNQFIARKPRPHEIHTLPLVHINTLYSLAADKPNLFEKAEKSKDLLLKIARLMKNMTPGMMVR